MFTWIRDHKRHELLSQPFPSAWHDILRNNMAVFPFLLSPEQTKLRNDLRIMMAETSWEGCGGLTITEEVQVTIAAHACLLLLGWEQGEFTHLESILVYPEGYVAKSAERLWSSWDSAINEMPSARLGEAWSFGDVVLSWETIAEEGGRVDSPVNIVQHEFAHILDMQNGSSDGVPHLPDDLYPEWAEVMAQEYEKLQEAVAHDHHSLIRAYGATNAAEFFAVATETFFGQGMKMRDTHPRLYDLFKRYYQQDTAARQERILAANTR